MRQRVLHRGRHRCRLPGRGRVRDGHRLGRARRGVIGPGVTGPGVIAGGWGGLGGSFDGRFPAVAGSAATVYFAESGEANGTVVYRPACRAGCQLSGDGTTALWDMSWTSWTGSAAVGQGTEKIDDCNPDCAQGTLHAVPVTVTFTKPVTAGCGASARRYWTQATFSWPHGLPAVLSGADAPANPFTYPGLGAGPCA